MKNFTKTKFVLLVLIAILISCSKDRIAPPSISNSTKNKQLNSAPVTVLGIAPSSGIVYTAITITGSNFDTAKINNIVKINGVTALVNSATASQIIATVPAGAATGNVTVTTNKVTAQAPAPFKVLRLVKDGDINQPADPLTALAFDKSNNIYGLQNFASANHNTVVKYANGVLTTLYKTPNDTIKPGIHGYNYHYSYRLVGLATDSHGNIYTGLVRFISYYSVTPQIPDSSWYTTRILKITPTGRISTFATKFGTQVFENASALAIDPGDNVYVTINSGGYRQKAISPTIAKITPTGVVSVFYTADSETGSLDNVIADKDGNIYDGEYGGFDQVSIRKFTPDGSSNAVIAGPYSAYDNLNTLVIDASENVIATDGSGRYHVVLVNHAGFAANIAFSGVVSIYFPLYRFFTDNFGRLYTVNATTITRYSFQ